MKKFKSVIAAALAAVMVLTMAGCEEEGENAATSEAASIPTGNNNPGGNEGNGGGGDDAVSEEESINVADINVDFYDSDTAEAALAVKDQLLDKEYKAEKRLKWFSFYKQEETSPAAILYKDVYGVPAKGDDPTFEGCLFEQKVTTYFNRFSDLSAAISADLSPDLCPFDSTDFPYGALLGRYQPIDDIVDVNSERWSSAKRIMDQFALGGKHYCAVTGKSDQNCMWLLWYRKSQIESIGAEDPQELFKAGKWDWDAFLKISRAWKASGTEDDPKYAIDGYNTPCGFICTTGTPQVSAKDGKVVSNYYSADFERAMDKLILVMHNEQLRYPYEELNSYNQNPVAWAKGQTLFFCEGSWTYQDNLYPLKRKYKWPDDEIKVVPIPKDPAADKHYAEGKVNCYMWVKGSQNKEGVAKWFDCIAVTANDPTVIATDKERAIKDENRGWTPELVEFVFSISDFGEDNPLTFVFELKNGLGPNASGDGSSGDYPVYTITVTPYISDEYSFTTLREENKGIIDAAIKEINDRIG